MENKQIRKLKTELDKIVDFHQENLKAIRAGRVNSQLIEQVKVDYYGVETPLQQVASVTVQDARTVVITPWEKDNLVNVENAIKTSDLGVNPVNDGQAIRLVFPALTEERRNELIKLVGKNTEEARIKVRQKREETWSQIQEAEKNGEISEDDKFHLKDELQKVIDEVNDKINELSEKKEKAMEQI